MQPPSSVRSLALAGLAVLAGAAALSAQATGPMRVPSPGRVFDADHKPVAGAKITLVARGEQDGLDGGDLVRVEADAEGRFRAALQPTRRYVAWATATRDTSTFVSSLVEVGTDAIELEIAAMQGVTQLRFGDLDPWRPFGKLHVRVVPFDCTALAFEGDLDTEATVTVPSPLPPAEYTAEITCAGKLVDAMDLTLGQVNSVRPPQRLKVRVADEQAAPVAKATVFRIVHRWASRGGPFLTRPRAVRWPVATTDDAGTAELLVASATEPLRGDDWAMWTFVATHEGFVEGMSGRVKQPFVNGLPIKDVAAMNGVLPFVLRRGEVPVIKVQAPVEAVPGEVQWLAARSVPYEGASNTTVLDGARPRVVDGAFRLAGKPDGDDQATLAIAGCVPRLAADDPWHRLVRPMTLVLPVDSVRANPMLDLRSLQAVRLQVVDASGAPAMGAEVLCVPKAGNRYIDTSHATRTVTDRAGRGIFPMLPGGCFVVVVHGNAIAHAAIDVQPGLAPQTLQLQSLACMRVVVRDTDGKPLAGARFDGNGASWGGGGSAEIELLCHLGFGLSSWSLGRATSDATGRADLYFLAVQGLQIRCEVRHEKRIAVRQLLSASDEPIEITLH